MESDLSKHLQFLNDSSYLLATTAPTTSRYLMSRCHSLMFESDIDQPKSQGRKACGACGSIMILGYEATIGLERNCKRKGNETAKAIVYKCDVCNVKTRFPINAAPKSTNRPWAISKIKASSMSQTDAHIQLASGSAAPKMSRKRSKSAKQGGLKALLQKKTQNTPRASGFDLMDFMKKAWMLEALKSDKSGLGCRVLAKSPRSQVCAGVRHGTTKHIGFCWVHLILSYKLKSVCHLQLQASTAFFSCS